MFINNEKSSPNITRIFKKVNTFQERENYRPVSLTQNHGTYNMQIHIGNVDREFFFSKV